MKTNKLQIQCVLLLVATIGLCLFKNEALALPANKATSENIAQFELKAPALTAAEQADTENADMSEQDGNYQYDLFEDTMNLWETFHTADGTDEIKIEIYQGSKKVGKQFILARQNGKIRFVFATSTGKDDHPTPIGEYGVTGQRWRHMSTKYPSANENNMDHLTYFRPMYGLHSTTFGGYAKLGRKDSHGCVRLGRPEARAIYSLIKTNLATTNIVSYAEGQEPADSEVALIRKQLALDFNLIQYMLDNHNTGDTPMSEKQYLRFLETNYSRSRSPLKEVSEKTEFIEILPEQDLGRSPKRAPVVEA